MSLPATKCPTCQSKMSSETVEDKKERVIARKYHCPSCGSDWRYSVNERRMRRVS